MINIKICGLTNTSDALLAVRAGATHLGIIFVQESPRCINLQDAQKIVEAVQKKAVVVGVFQNQSPETIAETVVKTGIDAVQLHGDEDPAFCRSIALRLGKDVIKTIILKTDTDKETTQFLLNQQIAAYGSQVACLLFDRAKGQLSGEWLSSALAQVSSLEKQNDPLLPPYFFAGGLTPDSIEDVLANIKPFGLDVASGVETSPGQKDPALVTAFIAKAKNQTVTGPR
jgi:phosphoribosylanthranilate isomerase